MADVVEGKFGRITVRIHRSRCIASGNCVKIAPEVFELDAESVCAFVSQPLEIEEERLKEACEVCPVDALEWQVEK